MAENPLDKSPKENQPAVQSNIDAGGIDVGRDVSGNIFVGNGNVINLPPEQQVFRSLHQLPQPPTDFTGRTDLIKQLVADFETGGGAAITGRHAHGLTGMGGIGKTALGLAVADKIAKYYPDAQIFLDLKGTTTPLSTMEIMRHIVLSFEPAADVRTLDEAGMSAAYRSVLHGKRAFLFFDNARSAGQIAPLRPPQSCAMLVTSRWSFPVPGLSLRRLDLLSEEDAKAFLLELCPRIGEKAGELASACAYLPLALRIAGSFLQVNGAWEVEKYLARLNDHKQRLAALKESREEAELVAEPDLLATFELSYNGLSEENRERWRMLGVFPKSFDSSAAQAMWDLEEDETRRMLGVFLRYNLLEYDEASSRYSLHDLLADYARSQMNAQEEHKARLKHAFHYNDVLSTANSLYSKGGEKVLTGLRLLDLEWENIRTGQASVSQIPDDKDYLELCNEYLGAGYLILPLRLHPRENIAWLERGLDAAQQLGKKEYEAAYFGNLGNRYRELGDARKAIEFYEQALAIAREIGNRSSESANLDNLGIAYKNLGDAHKAIEFYEQALAIAREIGDRRGEGNALGNLGIAYYSLGDAHKAIEFYEQALTIDREIGDRRGEGNALNNLGLAYAALGDVRKAIGFHEQSLAIKREIGDRRGEGQSLGNLGNAHAALGDVRKAIEFHEQALTIDREIGDRRNEGIWLGNLGNAYAALGDARQAIEFYEKRMEIAREIGDPRGEALGSWNMGLAYEEDGELGKAIELMQIRVEYEHEIGHPDAEKHAARVEELRKKLQGYPKG